MLWIGLTGGIATGKSTAARMLQEMGYPVVSADQVAREVVEPGQEGAKVLLHRFGPSFFDSNGKLNRPKLAAHIFSNSAARAEVESVLHPLIQRRVEQVQEEFKLRGEKVAFYDVPLLFEKKLVPAASKSFSR